MSLFQKLRRQLAPATIQDQDSQSGTAKFLAIVLFVAVIGGLTLAVALAAKPTNRYLKERKATKLLQESGALIADGKIEEGAKLGAEAFQLAPTNPLVIENLAEIASDVGSADAGFLWEQYERVSEPSVESRAGVAMYYATSGKLDDARKIIGDLLETDGQNIAVLKSAHVLAESEGDSTEAFFFLGEIEKLGALDDRRRLLFHIRRSETEALEARWMDSQVIWEYAKRKDRFGLEAIDYLLAKPPEADLSRVELVNAVNSHPEAGEVRKIHIVELMRQWSPSQAGAILETAIRERRDLPPADLYPLLRLLAAERQFDHILDLVEPYSDLQLGASVRYKCDALASQGRWEEVQTLIGAGGGSLLPHQQSLYEAHVALNFEEDTDKAGRKLEKALREASEAYQPLEVIHVANYGLKNGFEDMALRAYRTAENFDNAKKNALISLLRAGRQIGKADVVAEALDGLCRHDSSADFLGRLAYIELIQGTGVEKAAGKAIQAAIDYPDSDLWRLNLALARFRYGDPSAARSLAQACELENLEPQSAYIATILGGQEPPLDRNAAEQSALRLLDAEEAFVRLIAAAELLSAEGL